MKPLRKKSEAGTENFKDSLKGLNLSLFRGFLPCPMPSLLRLCGGTLEKTGLSIVKDNRKFDRFKGRVMFPIHSMSGRILGFGGRTLSSDKRAAKYLNSPESIIYYKSKILYGIYQAKQSIAKQDNCYLVEGYTDVISMWQSGIEIGRAHV